MGIRAVVATLVLTIVPGGGLSAGSSQPNTTPAAEVTVEDFAWMAGYWRGEGLGGVCEEIWSEPLAGSMIGIFRLVRDREAVFSEHMTLGADAEGFALKVKHFTPDFVAWEEKEGAVRFALEAVRPNEAAFNGLRILRTDEGNLEITLRLKSKGGEARDEVFRLRPHPAPEPR